MYVSYIAFCTQHVIDRSLQLLAVACRVSALSIGYPNIDGGASRSCP
jgi:hypothetical protein